MAEENKDKFCTFKRETIRWNIENFADSHNAFHEFTSSPAFQMHNSNWQLNIFPNGHKNSSLGYIGLFLHRLSSTKDPIHASITFSLMIDNKMLVSKTFEHTYESVESYGISDIIQRRKILSCLKYNEVLTVVCTVSDTNSNSESNTSNRTSTLGTHVFNELRRLEEISGIKILEDSTKKFQGIQTLSENFERLYLNEEYSDVKIKVGPKEFSAHKLILAARSPVFASMFRHKMTENIKGNIDISDCEPESFEIFLKFLYTGKMNNVCYSNALGLYKTADKYCLDDLKKECVARLCEGMEVESVCDVLDLAAVYEETELLKAATEFFTENAKDIFVTEKWQSLLIEKPTFANECLRKMAEKKF